MGEDKRNLFDPVLKGRKVKIEYPITLTADDLKDVRMYRNTAIRNGILCLLAQRGPKHFKNGTNMILNRTTLSDYNSPERHHIFPRAFLRKHIFRWNENSIINLAFIPSELNKEILSRPPNKYFSEYQKDNPNFSKILVSHLIPHDKNSSIWVDNYDGFIEERANLILKEIKVRVGALSMLQVQLDEDPSQVIDSLEANIRAIIDENLTEKNGLEYWKDTIPGDIQEIVKDRILEREARYPDKDVKNNLERLSFCDIEDYRKIITSNWALFEDMFISKAELERNFIYLKDYRNGVRHVRDLTPIEKKHGEAAVEWFITRIKNSVSAVEEND